MSKELEDIRALYISSKDANLSGTGQAELTISMSDSLISVSHDPLVVIDFAGRVWATNRKGFDDKPPFGEVRDFGECGSSVGPDECFAVIDINNDEHLENASRFVGRALIGRLKLWRRP